MKVVVIQPSYIPWLGYFYMMKYADLFIYFDDVQFDKNGWRNRNKILIDSKEKWLTLPIDKSSFMGSDGSKLLNNVTLKGDPCSLGYEHKRILSIHYKRSHYLNLLDEAYSKNIFSTSLLADVVIHQTNYFKEILDIDTKIVRSSSINYPKIDATIDGETDTIKKKNFNLLSLLKEVEATEYLSGLAANNYLDEMYFEQNNIHVTWNDFNPNFKDGYLSIIHHLLTSGQERVLKLLD